MPRASDGSYSQPPGTAAIANTIASSAAYNDLASDIGAEITKSLSRDGQGAMRANLGFGGFKGTNAAVGTLSTDMPTVNQVQTLKVGWADSGGTADAITVTFSPNITALVDGMRFRFRAAAANTVTTPTLTLGTTAAKTIVKANNLALLAGDIPGDNYECEGVYNASLDKHVLLNPITQTVPGPTLGGDNAFSGVNTFNNDVTINGTLTASEDFVHPQTILTPAANVALDLASGSYFTLTIDRNSTLQNPTNDVRGQEFWLRVIQNGSSGWTLAFDTQYQFSNDVAEQIDPGTSATTLYRGFVKAADNIVLTKMYSSARNSIGFYKEYDLGTYQTSHTYTQAHGLASPAAVHCYLKKSSGTDDNGYTNGDYVIFNWLDTTNSRGVSAGFNATNAFVRTPNNLPQVIDSSHSLQDIDISKWHVIARVYE